jgi:hypothetical protein
VPCDSRSARVNPSLRALELGPHLPHIPDHMSSGRSGALRSLSGRGAAIGPQLIYCTGGRAIVMHEMTSTLVKVADLHQAKSSPPERLALMLGHVAVDRPVMVPPSRCSGH